MFRKYSKHSKSVGAIQYYYDELIPYSKYQLEETIAGRVKLNPHKRKKEIGTGTKILPLNKLLARLSVLLAQLNTGNNSYKLRNEIRQIIYVLYQHNKMTKINYNNLIKSL